MTATIAIVGERIPDFPPHVATDDAIAHSAEALGVVRPQRAGPRGRPARRVRPVRVAPAVDVGVVAEPLDDLLTSPLAADELLAVLPVDHPLADRGSVPIAELGREPFIMPAGGCAPLICALAQEAGARLRRHYEVRDTVSIASMVRERLGVTIMPELSIPDDRSGLRVLPLDPPAERRLSLAVLQDAEPLPAALALLRLAEVRSAVRADHQAV